MSKIKTLKVITACIFSLLILYIAVSLNECRSVENKEYIINRFKKKENEYNKLVEKLASMPQLERFVNFSSNNVFDYMFDKNRITLMINDYYTRDINKKKLFRLFDDSKSNIYSFEYGGYKGLLFTIDDVCDVANMNRNDILFLCNYLSMIDTEIIYNTDNCIEFSDKTFLFSTSLDYYSGIAFMENGNDKYYSNDYQELQKISGNFYFFTKNHKKIINH